MPVPTLNGQIIGRAHQATRAVLESRLPALGLTFRQSLALNALASGKDREQVIDQLAGGLKIDRAEASAVADSLPAQGLADPSVSALTDAGRDVQAKLAAETAQIIDRLYSGIAPEDLAVAARVLTTITDRANAELS
ncbi:MarR family winged helix-turn-helix transcriptional regulator [Actinomadura rupiterrae]|uniref:MarR family winged helix-turn-helix transcriptional regulator n=1 Tax=Actinomadura rupiterrae TaxID=559627 RepID=UPI0020A24980|nr:MarR family winged helix-turn-helix transcriptional regulator [Actinomadura rupiterrae]MCP2336701.1 DNA-binding MarR family transcriptional regulator [Actinomadura rupiterrae]